MVSPESPPPLAARPLELLVRHGFGSELFVAGRCPDTGTVPIRVDLVSEPAEILVIKESLDSFDGISISFCVCEDQRDVGAAESARFYATDAIDNTSNDDILVACECEQLFCILFRQLRSTRQRTSASGTDENHGENILEHDLLLRKRLNINYTA